MTKHSPESSEQPTNLTAIQQELAEIVVKPDGKPAATIRPCRQIAFETSYAIIEDE